MRGFLLGLGRETNVPPFREPAHPNHPVTAVFVTGGTVAIQVIFGDPKRESFLCVDIPLGEGLTVSGRELGRAALDEASEEDVAFPRGVAVALGEVVAEAIRLEPPAATPALAPVADEAFGHFSRKVPEVFDEMVHESWRLRIFRRTSSPRDSEAVEDGG